MDTAEMTRPVGGSKRALVLSGGGGRGAFQAGALMRIWETGWRPDLICGTSVGAITAVALASGMPPLEMADFFRTHPFFRLYRISVTGVLRALFPWGGYAPLLEVSRLRDALEKRIDFGKVRRSPLRVVISTVDIRRGRVRYFENPDIDIEKLMASCAMPGLFPIQAIDGAPHWDGGVMETTPLRPALARGAREIIAITFSPVGVLPSPVPRTLPETSRMVFEQTHAAPFIAELERLEQTRETGPEPRIYFVASRRVMGLGSLVRFDRAFADKLIREGYRAACEQLPPHLETDGEPAK